MIFRGNLFLFFERYNYDKEIGLLTSTGCEVRVDWSGFFVNVEVSNCPYISISVYYNISLCRPGSTLSYIYIYMIIIMINKYI